MNFRGAAFAASILLGQVALGDALDDYIRADMKARNVPEIAFGVFKDGKILRQGAYGFSNLELGVPAKVDNVFEIGSVSKQFTATILLKLREERKVELEDRLDKYLNKLPETWRGITLRHLLNHTSGIPDIEEIFGYDSYRNIYTYDQIIAVANSKPIEFAMGEKWHYSNTNYFLLAYVLQKIEGKPYDAILQERILKPLGMSHTRQSDPSEIIPNRSAGYQRRAGGLGNRDAMQTTACLGAGTIVSTIGDMAIWDSAINHNRIIKPESQKLMWEKTTLPKGEVGYGFGWFVDEWRSHPCVEHSGGTAGFSCDYRRFQDLGISVMVFSNLYANDVFDISIRAVDSVHPGLSLASVKPIKEDSKARERFMKALTDLSNGGESSPYYTEKMWKQVSSDARKVWKQRLSSLKSFELLEHTKYAATDSVLGEPVVETYSYRLRTGTQTIFVHFKLTTEGKIALQQRTDN